MKIDRSNEQERELQVSRRTGDGVMVLTLRGSLSGRAEEELLSLHDWQAGLGEDILYLIMDLRQVAYINSLGIAVLIRIVRSLHRAGCQTFAFGVSPHYQKLFRMVGLTEYMMIYPDEYAIRERIAMLPS